MAPAISDLVWALVFVLMEAVQFVYFGGIFQSISSFLFGFLVFGIVAFVFIGSSMIYAPNQLALAFRNPSHIIGANLAATLAWASYLTSIQIIEPAVVFTISAGTMPITAWLCHRFGVPEGQPVHNRIELAGLVLLLAGIIHLAVITVSGHSGFVRGDQSTAMVGVLLAISDGVFFTWMIIFCQRMDGMGVGAGTVFGLRFPLYVIAAGSMAAMGVDAKPPLPAGEILVIVLLGLVLTVPHLFALQKAVARISTAAISTLTALGPFVVFILQMFEGRVSYSNATLTGLGIYFSGAILSMWGISGNTEKTVAKPVDENAGKIN